MFETEGCPVIPIGIANGDATGEPDLDLGQYDRILVAFSGGADSVACVLRLLSLGVDPQRLELCHHLVDGRKADLLMDWPVTEAYGRAFAKAFGLPIYFPWKIGGIEWELLGRSPATLRV